MQTQTNTQPPPEASEIMPRDNDGFKVIRLQASNVKRLRAVDITPDPGSPLVVVGGNNGEGKSSAIDSILYAIGGKATVAKDPIRHGQTKASVMVDLGDYIAIRRFTPTGQQLELKTKDGANVPSPQAFLDSLAGVLNFDPLTFSRMPAPKRLQTLIELVPLSIDLDDLARKRKEIFDNRTDLNRRKRDLEGELRQIPEPDSDLPAEPIDVSALVAEKNELNQTQKANDAKRQELQNAEERQSRWADDIKEYADEVERLKEELAKAEKTLAEANEMWEKAKSESSKLRREVVELQDPDTSDIDNRISQASDVNARITRAREYRAKEKTLKGVKLEIDSHSLSIEELDQMKEGALAAATFPIEGLRFADGDVSYNGVLFDQLSSAEQVRVSLAMAMAMNPKLRVILIKDGSLLDETSLGMIREMAQAHGFQVWLEVVGNRSDATVVIEDGAVVGNGDGA